jgi:hypothetical protein
VVHQLCDQASIEAVGAQQRLRRAIGARGRERGESAALLGSDSPIRQANTR